MELQIVTFEQAKILKELGFPQDDVEFHSFYTDPTTKMYGIDEHGRYYPVANNDTNLYDVHWYAPYESTDVYIAPSLELVVKWLREEKNFHIFITHLNADIFWWEYNIETLDNDFIDHGNMYSTYEEALSAGIDKAIEILRKRENDGEAKE